MKSSEYKPIEITKNIFSIEYDELDAEELLFDFDGTLVHGKGLPDKKTIQLLVKLQERFRVRIFSNNWVHGRARAQFFAEHGIEYTQTYKPFGAQPISSAVLIGDKLLTDGLYGLRRNIPVYLVAEMHSIVWNRVVRFLVE